MPEKEIIISFLSMLGDKGQHYHSFLKFLANEERSGWEKWIQFELIRHINSQDKNHEFYWEDRYKLNGKTKKTKQLDLVYRPLNFTADKYVGIELKVQRYIEYSVNGILKDLYWLSKITIRETSRQEETRDSWNFRSILGIAFFSKPSEDNKRQSKYREFIKQLEEERLATLTEEIPGWYAVVINWQARSPKEDNSKLKESYINFYKKIRHFAKKHGIYYEPSNMTK
ncbi:hypothetical protein [Geothermobacter hydrogeniphilus]|uniref:Uncharacterized protein n=1 Tax=Geothermobacter hydrogeniphilus TaxID=1969733 RepID=A0A1X0XXA8_9BACT|nr:hypothetical protein [Geothermobacter hydrogeniphilus]ORJ57512.1 hypothetical protein B5V00_13765 [Geothermobacter hydrogeniphilus]